MFLVDAELLSEFEPHLPPGHTPPLKLPIKYEIMETKQQAEADRQERREKRAKKAQLAAQKKINEKNAIYKPFLYLR
ncbi:hypothetical protein NKR19_g8900 [Coniochaeta hoffmannii]|uniref:Uncharacterized protein n=1 Tax=Coniochaeta hoffmannii TaxID=91930 RepID=A0AA38VLE8_9PEZI|nr:hypothetical protein NKR19_g8900 [Coniochaeta hoffmannii]